MASGCGDVLSLQDLKTAKLHQIFEAEVITGKQGGVSSGADIDYATNQVTGQSQKTMPAILRDIGFTPASFDFTTGGTLTTSSRDVAVLWPLSSGGDGDYYYWQGALPKVIPAASTPASTGGVAEGAWRPVGENVLRNNLSSATGYAYIGEVSSFATLRTVTPPFNGARVKLRAWSGANLLGGGDFIGYLTAGADDGGLIASAGGGYHWRRIGYGETPTPEMFGAVGDNSADDTAAVQKAINTKRAKLSGNYRITAVIDVPSDSITTFHGGRLRIDYAGPALRMVDQTNITIDKPFISGTGKATGAQRGILIGNCSALHINNPTIRDLTGNGIHLQGGTVVAGYPLKLAIVAPMITGCDVGIYGEPNTVGGQYTNEYISITAPHVTDCFTGISQGPGNWNITGGRISDCIDAMAYPDGINTAHGTLTGMQLNHNSRYNLHAINCSAGLTVSGCTFFADNQTSGVIYLENSRGFTFDGCLIGASVYTDGAFSWNKATNCYNPGNFPMLFAGTHGNRFIVDNWTGTDGPYALNDEGWDFVSVNRIVAQSLTAGTDSVLIFSSLNQKNILQSYDLTAGTYTAPFTGFYSVKFSVKFVNVTAGYCSIKIGTGAYSHFPITNQTGGMCCGAADVFLTAGQVMTLTANTTGSSPQLDGGGGVSRLSIRKF